MVDYKNSLFTKAVLETNVLPNSLIRLFSSVSDDVLVYNLMIYGALIPKTPLSPFNRYGSHRVIELFLEYYYPRTLKPIMFCYHTAGSVREFNICSIEWKRRGSLPPCYNSSKTILCTNLQSMLPRNIDLRNITPRNVRGRIDLNRGFFYSCGLVNLADFYGVMIEVVRCLEGANSVKLFNSTNELLNYKLTIKSQVMNSEWLNYIFDRVYYLAMVCKLPGYWHSLKKNKGKEVIHLGTA